LSALARYVHTVRHLRPRQVAGRVWFNVYHPRPDQRPAPPQRPPLRSYAEPVLCDPTLVAPDTFRILNVERRCERQEDWSRPTSSKLWRYHLHYFDDLNARESPVRAAWHEVLLRRWVAENPPGRGDGWEPYPLSRRLVNWIKWALRGNELPAECHASAAVQARWLVRRLEYHLLGNHLFTNAKALVHAGLYYKGKEADGWYARGLEIIARELREQILPDGGHFERSTMYHAAGIEDLLDLVNVLRAHGRSVPSEWLVALARMRQWLAVMSHPDGAISFFNDAAFGVAPVPAQIEAYAARLGLTARQDDAGPVTVLETSGYARLRAGRAYLLCDCAPVGPDHLPAHAHADTLSFELSVDAERIFVNSGTSVYEAGVERQRQRSTAAHNTVMVDGESSSEMWAAFRVARRARSRILDARYEPPNAIVEAAHDGYRRLPGRNSHRRRWQLNERSLTIEDFVSGTFGAAEAFFHVHPAVRISAVAPRDVVLAGPCGGSVRVHFELARSVAVRSGTWHPRFGVALENRCIVALFDGPSLATYVQWDPIR
jgi:uncharacterized heparinase superfamily protein